MGSISNRELKNPRLGPVQKRILLHMYRNPGDRTVRELTDAHNPPRFIAWDTFRRSVHRSVFTLVDREYAWAYRRGGRGCGAGTPWRFRLTPRGVAAARALETR